MDKPKCRLCGQRHYGLCPASGSKEPEAKLKRQDDGPKERRAQSATDGVALGANHDLKLAQPFVEMGGQQKQPGDVQAHKAQSDALQIHSDASICPTCGQSRRGYMREYMRGYRKRKKGLDR